MLVAFYDMKELQWDYSLIPATTRDMYMDHVTLYSVKAPNFNTLNSSTQRGIFKKLIVT
jgi:hypothetical protein